MSLDIDKLIEDYGREEVDRLFTEYFLKIIFGNRMFEEVKNMIESRKTLEEIKVFIQRGITDDEAENFYT